MMADRPIIFSAPMVRALLDGRKTETRRLINPAPIWEPEKPSHGATLGAGWSWGPLARWSDAAEFGQNVVEHVRFSVGDRLWVRETCRAIERNSGLDQFQYRATLDWEDGDAETIPNTPEGGGWGDMSIYGRKGKGRKNFAQAGDGLAFAGPWVPAIHVPRAASRLTLTVTDVRVQRLQDISERDAKAEGLEQVCIGGLLPAYRGAPDLEHRIYPDSAYGDLWDSLHTEPGTRWADSPWIVAVTFTVARGNIDQLPTP